MKRIIALAKAEKITSIADFLGARYGKSFAVASIATLIAVVGAVPYIALQLKAISGSVSLMVEHYSGAPLTFDPFVSDISLIIAMLLALFAVLFGTRHADATEHQDGLVLAVAVESVVKLAAFLAVGIFVTFFLFDSPQGLIDALAANSQVQASLDYRTSLGTWLVMTALSGFAIIMLPRQFYVMIVENRAETELRTATWVFPLYLIAINLFVLPVALAGLALVGDATSSDLYVLSLPLLNGHDFLAMAAFIGGLSAATAMVIVASVALSIMISNDLVIPLFVRRLLKGEPAENGDWSSLILNIRRASIFIILFVAFLYYRESTNNARLASIGLMSFAAIAQFAPVLLRRTDLARRQRPGRRARHGGGHRCLGLHAALPVARRARHRHPDQRAVRHRGAAAAGAVRHRGRAAQPRRHVEPVDQPHLLRARLALPRLGAAGAHPGVDLRAARRRPDAEPEALPHRHHRQRPQGHDLALSRRRAHRALVPDLRGEERRAERQRAGRAWTSSASPSSCSPARSARPRRGLSCRCSSSAATAPPRTRSGCSTTRPRRCSTTATCCRSRSTRWNRASPSSTRISA